MSSPSIYRDPWTALEMYAFYSLLVYIFYTVFKKEEDEALEGACGASSSVRPTASYQAKGGLLIEKESMWGDMHVSDYRLPFKGCSDSSLNCMFLCTCLDAVCKYFCLCVLLSDPHI